MISIKMYSEFIIVYDVSSSISLTRENFCLDEALMVAESSAYDFTHLMPRGIFHRKLTVITANLVSFYSPHTSRARCCRTWSYPEVSSDPGL